jgi:hypothetical protein
MSSDDLAEDGNIYGLTSKTVTLYSAVILIRSGLFLWLSSARFSRSFSSALIISWAESLLPFLVVKSRLNSFP